MNNTSDTVSILKQLEAWAKTQPNWPEQERKLREFERQLKKERELSFNYDMLADEMKGLRFERDALRDALKQILTIAGEDKQIYGIATAALDKSSDE